MFVPLMLKKHYNIDLLSKMKMYLMNFLAETEAAKQAALFSLAEIVQKVFVCEHFLQLQYSESLML